jgi:hypothetical protein
MHYLVHSSTLTYENYFLSFFIKTWKWAVMHLCVMGIDFISFYNFSTGFLKCSDCGIFCFSFYFRISNWNTFSTLIFVLCQSVTCVRLFISLSRDLDIMPLFDVFMVFYRDCIIRCWRCFNCLIMHQNTHTVLG